MLSSRQELDRIIADDLLFYDHTKQTISPSFLDFIHEDCSIFTQATDFQYILVPQHLLQEFQTQLETPTQSIYYDDLHHHYIDPHMKKSFLRFCQVHQALPLYQKIKEHTLHIPPEIITGYIPPNIFRLLMDCVDPQQIAQLLPTTTGQDALYIANIVLQHANKFPFLFIHHVFITNWLVQQGCPLAMLEQMKNNGLPLKFPVCVIQSNMMLSPIREDIVGWCFKQHNGYPLDTSIDHIIMNPSYRDCDHFHYVYYSIRHGHHPSKTGFSILLKKTDLRGKDLFFTDYVVQELKKNGLDMDIWTEVGWQENQDKTIQLVMEFCGYETQTFMVIYLCMNMMDIIYANMDYWVLRLRDQFDRYMKFIHLVKFRTERHENIRHIDKRIVGFIQDPIRQKTPPTTYPPFYKHHPQSIVFYTPHHKRIEIPVYLGHLNSGLINRILNPNGFKKTNKDKNRIELHIPDIFRDQEKTMWDWIMYSYLQQIPPQCSTEDVAELFHLSQYMMDDQCERQTLEWLDHQYMMDFEIHHQHNHCHDECILCSFWDRSIIY